MKKKTSPLIIIAIVLSIISIIGTFLIYPSLPEIIPTHFNIAGEPNEFSSKNTIFIIGALPLFLIALILLTPKFDPKKHAFKKHVKAYNVFILSLTLFLIAIHWATTLFSLGYPVSIQKIVPIGLGLLFISIGNYMPQIRPNYTFGIKFPWTLDNEDNWRATHRVGGYGFIIVGVLSILSIVLPGIGAFIITLGGMCIMMLGVGIYSYLYYRKHPKK